MFDNKFDWNTIITFSSVAVQIIGFGIAFFIIQYQFRKQREIEAENFKNSVNIDFYKDLVSKMNDLSLSLVSQELYSLITSFEVDFQFKKHSSNGNNELFNLEEFNKTELAIQKKLLGIIEVLDSYSVVLENIQLLKQFLSVKIQKFRSMVSSLKSDLQFSSMASTLEFKDGESEEKYLDRITAVYSKRHREIDKLGKEIENWIYDLKVEIQNKLLYDYFGRKVLIRTNDDSGIVLTSTDKRMLLRIQETVSAHDISHFKAISEEGTAASL